MSDESRAKRAKYSHVTHRSPPAREIENREHYHLSRLTGKGDHTRCEEIPDSEAESGSEDIEFDVSSVESQRTDVENALPPIKNDAQAIEDYEAFQASSIIAPSDLKQRLSQRSWNKGKSSIYVDAFNLALDTVLEEESHLFNDAEMKVFSDWKNLGYEAQYLYVRLFLRKTAAWHRIDRLGYHSDIGNMSGAISELFEPRRIARNDDDLKGVAEQSALDEEADMGEMFTFAENSDDHITSLEEASSLLMLEELKALAKEAKLQGRNKTELLRALRSSGETQTSLVLVDSKMAEKKDLTVSTLPIHSMAGDSKPCFAHRAHESHNVQRIMSIVGKCIRLSSAPSKLFERVHLVFYRSTEWTEKSLTTIILARISRRNFPHYIASRSSNIFPSRALLLEFEAALRAQAQVDSILEFNGTPTRESLQPILDIFEHIYPIWENLLAQEQRKEDSLYFSGEGAYLRRLSPAWVYTRIIYKASYVFGLGKIGDHAREHAVLSKLLSQRLFHASRRGAWYQRKALLEEHYMASLSPSFGRTQEEQKKHWRRMAVQTCQQGLEDNLVHIVYHYDLQKRTTKLEKALKIPKRLQHDFGHARLAKPTERTVEGVRIERRAHVTKPTSSLSTLSTTRRTAAKADKPPQIYRRSTKTIWFDPSPSSAPNSEVSVEAMCLSHYRALGWKGYHAEGGVLRTLFALLFYDVLFTYIPDVFQTPYQTCPLDLHTDAFFPSRMSEINGRLVDIANGSGEAILSTVWEREYDRRTCVVGLDWNFKLEDLQSIVGAFGGEKLATVCKIMAQEYAQRGGGVPDLFLWKDGDGTEAGEVLFVEVKSENDRLSDTQRLWIHVLTGAGIGVELCNAIAREVKIL